MRVVIHGHHPPGRVFGDYANVHVGMQVGSHPHALVPADTAEPEWSTEVKVVSCPNGVDFRGPAVHGRSGERFLYLTWGELDGDRFSMFRRAKLMLGDSAVDPTTGELVADIELTDERGLPRCARVREPALHWTAT